MRIVCVRGMRLVCENERKGRENYKKYERVRRIERVFEIKQRRHMLRLSLKKDESQRVIIDKSCREN